jgi:hypothetical protein
MTTTDRLLRSGLGRVVAFNWPKYGAGLAALAAGATIAPKANRGQRKGLALACAGLVYGIAASLAATWWVYDHRAAALYDKIASKRSGTLPWILVHAGFDESAGRLENRLGPPVLAIDIGPPSHRSPSLDRAHRLAGRSGERLGGAWPLEDDAMGFAVVLFGIHELERPEQVRSLLDELRRVVAPGGSIVVVEHLRDLANFSVYGPAALHFGPRRRWLSAMREAGMEARCSERVAGLVTVMVGQ